METGREHGPIPNGTVPFRNGLLGDFRFDFGSVSESLSPSISDYVSENQKTKLDSELVVKI